MKTTDNTYNSLDDILKQARQMKPVAEPEEILSMIKNAGVHYPPPKISRFYKTFKFKIIMSSTIIIFALYLTRFFMTTDSSKPESTQLHKNATENLQKIQNSPKIISDASGNLENNFNHYMKKSPAFNLLHVSANDLDFLYSGSELVSSAICLKSLFQNKESLFNGSKPSDEKPVLRHTIKDIKPIVLSDKQMSKIGFRNTKKGPEFECIVKGLIAMKYQVLYNGEDAGINNFPRFFNVKPSDYYPVFISKIDGRDLFNVDSTSQQQHNPGYTNYDKTFNLLPVLVKRPKASDTTKYKDLIFWFKCTPKLLDKLTETDPAQIEASEISLTGKEMASLSPTIKTLLVQSLDQPLTWNNRNFNLSKTAINGTKPLELDKSHLFRIGFIQTKNGLEYKANAKNIGTIYYANHYHEPSKVSDAFLEINGHDVYSIGKQDTRSTEFTNMSRPDLVKQGETGVDYYPVRISEVNGTNALNLFDFIPDSHEATDDYVVLPILVKQSDFNAFVGKKDLVFWFRVTPNLMSLLHDIDKDKINPIQLNLKEDQATMVSHTNQIKNESINQIALSGVKFLELKPEQLKKLGFTISKTGIKYNCNIRSSDSMPIQDPANPKVNIKLIGQGSFEFIHNWRGMSISIDGTTNGSGLGEGQDFYPVFISDRNGVQKIKYRFGDLESKDKWTNQYFASAIRKLVPILVKQNFIGSKNPQDLIFWFNVTPSFIASLPDTISREMNNEFRILNGTPNTERDTTKEAPTCKYFDVCQIPLEKELKVNIYPNPAHSILNVDFELLPGTTATLSMTNLNGQILKTLDQTYSGTGNQHVEINIGDMKSGIYLVILRLNNGIVITKRVMVAGE